MKRKHLKINGGGLYRCCLDSAAKWVEEDPEREAQDGEKIRCVHEPGSPETMTVDLGVIRWLAPSAPGR